VVGEGGWWGAEPVLGRNKDELIIQLAKIFKIIVA